MASIDCGRLLAPVQFCSGPRAISLRDLRQTFGFGARYGLCRDNPFPLLGHEDPLPLALLVLEFGLSSGLLGLLSDFFGFHAGRLGGCHLLPVALCSLLRGTELGVLGLIAGFLAFEARELRCDKPLALALGPFLLCPLPSLDRLPTGSLHLRLRPVSGSNALTLSFCPLLIGAQLRCFGFSPRPIHLGMSLICGGDALALSIRSLLLRPCAGLLCQQAGALCVDLGLFGCRVTQRQGFGIAAGPFRFRDRLLSCRFTLGNQLGVLVDASRGGDMARAISLLMLVGSRRQSRPLRRTTRRLAFCGHDDAAR